MLLSIPIKAKNYKIFNCLIFYFVFARRSFNESFWQMLVRIFFIKLSFLIFQSTETKHACIAGAIPHRSWSRYSGICHTLLYRMRSRYSGVCTPNAVQNGGSTLANVLFLHPLMYHYNIS